MSGKVNRNLGSLRCFLPKRAVELAGEQGHQLRAEARSLRRVARGFAHAVVRNPQPQPPRAEVFQRQQHPARLPNGEGVFQGVGQ
jgi:hypothetical protein